MVTYTLTKLDGTKVTRTAEKPKYGGTITTGPGNANESFDEMIAPPWTVTSTIGLVNEELVGGDRRRGPTGTNEFDFNFNAYLIPENSANWLAESWEIEGPTTIVWRLRKGIRWALDPRSEASRLVNGRELVADDVVFSMRRVYIDEKISSMYAMAGDDARPLNIYARDKYTVVAEAPPGYAGITWEYLSAWTRIVAPEVVKKYGTPYITDWRSVVGTGGYMLTDYVAQSSLTYTKNPNYWRTEPCLGESYPLPFADSVRILRIPDLSTELAAVRTGKIDISETCFDPRDFKSLRATVPWLRDAKEGENWRRGIYTSHRPIAWRMDNPALPWAPLDDPRALKVRRALYMAVDFESWVKNIYDGEGSEMSFLIPAVPMFKDMRVEPEDLPPAPDGFDNRKLYLNDKIGIPFAEKQKEAKRMLAEAGYPNGFSAEVILTTSELNTQYWEIVVSYWGQVGVTLKLNVVPTSVKETMRLKKTYNEMWVGSGATGHLYTMMYCRTGNLYNFSVFSDPWMDQTFLKVAANYFNPKERDALMKEVNLYSQNKLYNFNAPQPVQYRVWPPWVKNYYNGHVNMYDSHYQYTFAWLDQDLKRSLGR